MIETIKKHSASKRRSRIKWLACSALVGLILLAGSGAVNALTPNPNVRPLIPLGSPEDQGNSIGVMGTIAAPPPTQAATISTPVNGQSFTNDPIITIAGFCPDGTHVRIFNNSVFAGSVQCNNGSYSLQIGLFTGDNELSAIVYDDLDQSGPTSNIVIVTFNNAKFSAFGTLVTLTSTFARRGADPGKTLSWPITLSGGNGPYAVSIDWGDGQATQLLSQPIAGTFNIEHVYSSAGVYRVVIKTVDANGVPAFLQVVAVANGQATAVKETDKEAQIKTVTIVRVIWWPAVVLFFLALISFWLGRRYELLALHKRIEREAREFAEQDARNNFS